MEMLGLPQDAPGLGAALAIGLLIGLQRGWQERDLPEGGRVAGLRTFALTGLLGGVLGALLPRYGAWPLVAGRPVPCCPASGPSPRNSGSAVPPCGMR